MSAAPRGKKAQPRGASLSAAERKERLKSAKVRAGNHLDAYRSTGNGLAIWRAFRVYRSLGVPVDEEILKKLDDWARKLERASGATNIAKALQLSENRGGAGSASALTAYERRRRIFSEVQQRVDADGDRFKTDIYADVAAVIGPRTDDPVDLVARARMVKSVYLGIVTSNRAIAARRGSKK